MGGLGPRRRTKDGMVDNADTVLAESDLVFYDPSRNRFQPAAQPQFAAEFMNLQATWRRQQSSSGSIDPVPRAGSTLVHLRGELRRLFAQPRWRFPHGARREDRRHDPRFGRYSQHTQSVAFYDAMHIRPEPRPPSTIIACHRNS